MTAPKKPAKYVTFRVDAALVNRARAVAVREDRSIRSVIERALEQALPRPR